MEPQQDPNDHDPARLREAVSRRDYVACLAKCWPCNFGDHPGVAHTWMDEDDREHAGIPAPRTPEAWAVLAVNQPCGCYCQRDRGPAVSTGPT